MALSLTELQQMHDDLQRAYYKGELRVRFPDGREVQYSSADDMRKKITDLEDDIREASGAKGGNTSVAQHSRGDGPSGPPRWYW
ncbi:MAG: hypothetical protein ABSC23_03705 [Bryobacteraceae bacterium]|jgi:hypothetical protein